MQKQNNIGESHSSLIQVLREPVFPNALFMYFYVLYLYYYLAAVNNLLQSEHIKHQLLTKWQKIL